MHLTGGATLRVRRALIAILFVAGVLGGPAVNPAPALADAVVLARAEHITDPAQPGSTVTIVATALSSTDLTALVDVEVYDPTGWRAFQRFYDQVRLSANQTVRLPMQWSLPSGAARGTYTIKIGVVQPNWGPLYVWNNNAGSFVVADPVTPPSPVTAGGYSISVNPPVGTIAAGGVASLTATVTARTSVNALVDLEIFNQSGDRVWQRFLDNQVIDERSPGTFSFDWSVPRSLAAGSYIVKAGLTQPNWGPLYVWSNTAATVNVTQAGTSPATPTPTTPATPTPTTPARKGPGTDKMFGVNEAGGEFTPSVLPGTLNTNYIYPADSGRAHYFADRGLKLVRLPVLWERIQPSGFGPLASSDVAGIRAALDTAQAAGQMVILDLHNYGRYYNSPLGRGDAPKLANVWQQLAQAFGAHPALYGYELMNEPHDLPEGSDAWASLAQAATDAIRGVDRSSWVLVPGYSWQGAWTWPQQNASLNVNDSTGHLLYAAHQYFDNDGSGTYGRSYDAENAYPTIGADRTRPFLEWLSARNARGIFTEYGVPNSDGRWLTVLDGFLNALMLSPAIRGGTYWAAGPWWGNYPLSVEPSGGGDSPQLAVLTRYAAH